MREPDIGPGASIDESATIGVNYAEGSTPPKIGPDCVIRSGSILYDDVVAGSGFQTGHNALVREDTVLGDDVLVGTNSVLDGGCEVGDGVSLQTGVYVPRETTMGNRVFLGPSATLLNDMYPVRTEYELVGPTIEDDATVGGNTTVLPDVRIGRGAFVAAGAIVTDDVPAATLAVGAPARIRELPPELQGRNDL